MIAGIRRWFALRRMSARIEATLDRYGTVENMIVTRAQDQLAAMVAARAASPDIVEYLKRREAALRGSRGMVP